MYIVILNGSPRCEGNTETHIREFRRGAEESGHIVETIDVGRMRIRPCEACGYCHEQAGRKCRIDDAMISIYPSLKKADMVVFASPVHYFGFSAQMQALLSRIYCWHRLTSLKYALILSSGSPDVFDGVIAQYQHIVKYFGGRDEGILTVSGQDNKSGETLKRMYEFGRSVKDPVEEDEERE